MGISKGKPLAWHLKTAMVLAGQLPDNVEDARIVLQAVQDLMENFLSGTASPEVAVLASNILPFTG